MSRFVLPILFALFVWWFSTGVIVFLDGLRRSTFRWTVLGATALFVIALYGLWMIRGDTSVTGAYYAFAFGVAAWGWQEVCFLMGPMTGMRRVACAPDCGGWRHFGHGIQAVLYHELGILASAGVLVALSWGAANQLGLWIFLILWGMRQSAKLNLFLGVPNLSESFLPEHLGFLKSFLRRRSMNLLFPASITGAMIIVVILVQRAGADDAFTATCYTFAATMMALAILEHWFLVLPLPATALWKWSLRSHEAGHDPDEGSASAHAEKSAFLWGRP